MHKSYTQAPTEADEHRGEAEGAKGAGKRRGIQRLRREYSEQPTLQIQGRGGAKKKQEVAEVVHKSTI